MLCNAENVTEILRQGPLQFPEPKGFRTFRGSGLWVIGGVLGLLRVCC